MAVQKAITAVEHTLKPGLAWPGPIGLASLLALNLACPQILAWPQTDWLSFIKWEFLLIVIMHI